MAKGLLWHYFADGDDLMEQTARVTLADLRETVASDIDLSAEIPEVIRAAIRRAAALRESHRTELRAVREIVQNLRHPDGTPRFGLNDLYEETYTLQASLFQRGQDVGSLRSGIDTRYLAVTYQGAGQRDAGLSRRLPGHRRRGVRRHRGRHTPHRHRSKPRPLMPGGDPYGARSLPEPPSGVNRTWPM